MDGVASVTPALVSPDGRLAVLALTPATSPQDAATADLVERLRSDVLPDAESTTILFRSILVPVKAALLNVLSVAASYGVLVAVFQWGWGSGLIGVGLSVAVLLDVTLVRMVLVPAAMSLLGHRAWWLPAWLDRALPVIDLEGHGAGDPVPLTATAVATDREKDEHAVERSPVLT
jgi:uncharacterized membrane protein YdfJ with MMPL/SSD domain